MISPFQAGKHSKQLAQQASSGLLPLCGFNDYQSQTGAIFNPEQPSADSEAEKQSGFKMNSCYYKIVPCENDILCVEEDTDDLHTDDWRIYNQSLQEVVIKNFKDEALVAYPVEDEALFQAKAAQEYKQDRLQFKLQGYRDTNSRDGLSVIFSVQVERKNYLLCCDKEKKSIYFKEGAVPKSITGNTSNYIFYQQSFSAGTSRIFKFESSLEKRLYLACHHSDKRLFLKKATDEVDEPLALKTEPTA